MTCKVCGKIAYGVPMYLLRDGKLLCFGCGTEPNVDITGVQISYKEYP